MKETNNPQQIIQLDDGLYIGQVLCSGLRHGYGMMLTSTEVFLQGLWKLDRMHGPGLERTRHYEYNGEFFDGVREGFGNFFCARKNEWYSGMWRQGRRHGHGKIYHANGDLFEGNFKNNKKRGFGIKMMKDVIYQGNYSNGLKHGIFVFYRKSTNKTFQILYDFGRVSKVKTKRGFKALREKNLIEAKMRYLNRSKVPKHSNLKFCVKMMKKRETALSKPKPLKRSRKKKATGFDSKEKKNDKRRVPEKEAENNELMLKNSEFFKLINMGSMTEKCANPGSADADQAPLDSKNIFFNEIAFSSTMDSI